MKRSSYPLLHVCYDLTRLVERMDAGHPTGVDRVDAHYALWTRSVAKEWRGIVQRKDGVELLEAGYVDRLLRRLESAWLGGGASADAGPLPAPNGWSRESLLALREKLSRCAPPVVFHERGLPGWLLRVLPRACFRASVPGDRCGNDLDRFSYWNIGHCFRFERALSELLNRYGERSVFFLHDVIPLTHPQTQRPSSRAHFARYVDWIGRFGGRVLVSSEATLQSLRCVSQSAAVPLAPAVEAPGLVPLAVEDRFISPPVEPTPRRGLPYFLCVGTLEPRKNVDLLLEVWEGFVADGEVPAKLILVGRPTRLSRPQRQGIHRLRTAGAVELVSGIGDAALLQLMAGAEALLFPSLVEGWGLPLSEALAMGLPVLASDIPVFREVGQGVPEYLDPMEASVWRARILAVLAPDAALLNSQAQRRQAYRPTTWPEHFCRVQEVLGDCSEASVPGSPDADFCARCLPDLFDWWGRPVDQAGRRIVRLEGRHWFVKFKKSPGERCRDLLAYQLAGDWANIAETRAVREWELQELKGLGIAVPDWAKAENTVLVRMVGDYSVDECPQRDLEAAVAGELVYSLWVRRRDTHAANRGYVDSIPVFFDHGTAFLGEPELASIDRFLAPGDCAGSAANWRVTCVGMSGELSTAAVRRLGREQNQALHVVRDLEQFVAEVRRRVKAVEQLDGSCWEALAVEAGFDGPAASSIRAFLERNRADLARDMEQMLRVVLPPGA